MSAYREIGVSAVKPVTTDAQRVVKVFHPLTTPPAARPAVTGTGIPKSAAGPLLQRQKRRNDQR
jgi:hypothetical protein